MMIAVFLARLTDRRVALLASPRRSGPAGP